LSGSWTNSTRSTPAAFCNFSFERLPRLDNPRSIGEPLHGQFREYWKHRVGDYRAVSAIRDGVFVVLVLKVGHRREVHRL
jgi:mRNA interferase RelE/StbE